MEAQFKSSILLVCLNEDFGRSVSKKFAEGLSMHFADCKELVEYDLFNSGQILNQCGKDYYLMREKKVIMMACGYENTLMFSGYDLFNHSREVFKLRSTIVYLRLSKNLLTEKDKIDILAFDMRNSDLEKESDVIVDIKKLNQSHALKEIYKVLGAIQ